MDPLVPLSCSFLINTTPDWSFITTSIIIIIVLILASAFFSAVETALTCCKKARLTVKADEGSKSAKLALKVLKHYDQSLISILVGNNIVNTLAEVLASVIAFNLLRDWSLASIISSIIMTILIFTFGEIFPKNIAKSNADKLVLVLCYPLFFFYIISYPIMQIFNFFLWLFKLMFKNKEDESAITEDEFQGIVEDMQEEDVIDDEEADIIQAAVDFNDTTVKNVFTPKAKIISLDYNKLSRSEILKSINGIPFSRIPIYINNPDKIIGILNVRRFLKLAMSSTKSALKQSISETIKVQDNTSLAEMLNLFKEKKSHMAMVYDNDNKLVGLVTMEDVLEELIGEAVVELPQVGGDK